MAIALLLLYSAISPVGAITRGRAFRNEGAAEKNQGFNVNPAGDREGEALTFNLKLFESPRTILADSTVTYSNAFFSTSEGVPIPIKSLTARLKVTMPVTLLDEQKNVVGSGLSATGFTLTHGDLSVQLINSGTGLGNFIESVDLVFDDLSHTPADLGVFLPIKSLSPTDIFNIVGTVRPASPLSIFSVKKGASTASSKETDLRGMWTLKATVFAGTNVKGAVIGSIDEFELIVKTTFDKNAPRSVTEGHLFGATNLLFRSQLNPD